MTDHASTPFPAGEQALQRITAAYRQGDMAAVIALARSLPAPADAHETVRLLLGLALHASQRDDEAAACFRRLVREHPATPAYWNNLAITAQLSGALDEAEQAFRQALSLSPGDAQFHHNYGLLLARQGRWREARQCQFDAVERAPGFIDAHGHIMDLGFRSLELDLSDTHSLDEAKAKIAAYIAANPDKKWILGGGWNQEQWGLGHFPTAADLDSIAQGRPIVLDRIDSHAVWVDSAAMKAAGITPATKAPPGGQIVNGVFVDAARALIEKALPQPLARERDLAFINARRLLLSNGVTATPFTIWRRPASSSTRSTANLRSTVLEPGNSASMVVRSRSVSPGGPAMVSGSVRRLTSWASRMKKGSPAKWSPWRWVMKMLPMRLGSTPNLRIAIIDEAPQSMSRPTASLTT